MQSTCLLDRKRSYNFVHRVGKRFRLVDHISNFTPIPRSKECEFAGTLSEHRFKTDNDRAIYYMHALVAVIWWRIGPDTGWVRRGCDVRVCGVAVHSRRSRGIPARVWLVQGNVGVTYIIAVSTTISINTGIQRMPCSHSQLRKLIHKLS